MIFRGITFSTVDDRKDYGEKRTITIGKIADQIPGLFCTQIVMAGSALSPRVLPAAKKERYSMTTVRKSLNELTISKERLAQLEALQVADVVTSDIPELDVTFWENAKLSVPAGKKQLTIRLDADVLAWLKAQGKGYQSRINAILRSYYEAHQGKAS